MERFEPRPCRSELARERGYRLTAWPLVLPNGPLSRLRGRVREGVRSQAQHRCVVDVRNPLPSPLPEGRGSRSTSSETKQTSCTPARSCRSELARERSYRLTPWPLTLPNGPLSRLRGRVREGVRSQAQHRCVVDVRNPLPSPLPEGRGSRSASSETKQSSCTPARSCRSELARERGYRLAPWPLVLPNGPLSRLRGRVREGERPRPSAVVSSKSVALTPARSRKRERGLSAAAEQHVARRLGWCAGRTWVREQARSYREKRPGRLIRTRKSTT
ncbi:hypothetical protein SAMN06295949_11028 [Pseudomonas delhiensis]|uniref:Uncharacterized protein n=1 Tax=Pseudomonas delhiensis TaxID=366289 RepID=A0ABY1STL7_9PSED|nr:hypothetical protein SAMN06295949_11028 [Pseudomonas delhiensis]